MITDGSIESKRITDGQEDKYDATEIHGELLSCFGKKFDINSDTCLDCQDQDDCETQTVAVPPIEKVSAPKDKKTCKGKGGLKLVPPADEAPVERFGYTIFTAVEPEYLSKEFCWDPDWKVQKKSGGVLVRGTATKIDGSTIAEFAERLKCLTPREACSYGVLKHASSVVIAPEKDVCAHTSTDGAVPVIARTRVNFEFKKSPGVMMLDIDPAPDAAAITQAEALHILYETWPELQNGPHVWIPSASSYIYDVREDDEKEVNGLRGQRVYVFVQDASDIPRAGQILFERFWLNGHGHVDITASGARKTKSFIDGTVFQPERLDFNGGAKCGFGLEQRNRVPVIYNETASFLDTRTLHPLSVKEDDELRKLKKRALKAVGERAALVKEAHLDERIAKLGSTDPSLRLRLAEAIETGRLVGNHPVETLEHGRVTVEDILRDKVKFNGCHCYDPVEPGYRGGDNPRIGLIRTLVGKPHVYSLAHGGSIYPLILFTLSVGGDKMLPETTAARALAPHLQDLAFDRQAADWMQYTGGKWFRINEQEFKDVVQIRLDELDPGRGYATKYLEGIRSTLRTYLRWDGSDSIDEQQAIPFKNGVLFLDTMTLKSHKPEYHFRWQLPYNYDATATCAPIQDWMRDAVGGDKTQVEFLRAHLAAVVRGRYDFQRYLELIGIAGSGKGTYTRLAIAIVGEENAHATDLKRLEEDKFELANLRDKRLVYISDAGGFTGQADNLRKITGGDPLPVEEKFKQRYRSAGAFIFKGMVLVAANNNLVSLDKTSGLQRRRITMEFNNVVRRSERRDLDKEFSACLPGLINWVLEMPDERIKQLIVETEAYCPSMIQANITALLANNRLAQWVDECLMVLPGALTPVGRPGMGEVEKYKLSLYCSYSTWAAENDVSKKLANNSFSSKLKDLFEGQLTEAGVRREEAGFVNVSVRGRGIDKDALSPVRAHFQALTAAVRGAKV